MSKILFFDVDGPMVPARALFLPNNIKPRYGWQFDPCAVGMLNFLGWAVPDLEVVIASHRCGMMYPVKGQETDTDTKASWEAIFKDNGLKLKLHENWCTVKDPLGDRDAKIVEIEGWLERNSGVTHFVTFEDEAAGYDRDTTDEQRKYLHLCGEDYLNGITWNDLERAVEFLGQTKSISKLMDEYRTAVVGRKMAARRIDRVLVKA